MVFSSAIIVDKKAFGGLRIIKGKRSTRRQGRFGICRCESRLERSYCREDSEFEEMTTITLHCFGLCPFAENFLKFTYTIDCRLSRGDRKISKKN